jgi:hypothetical protein
MRPILTPFLSLLWATVFGGLAMAASFGGEDGAGAVLRIAGMSAGADAGLAASALLASALALVGLFNIWACATCILLDRTHAEGVLRLAHGASAAATLLLLAVAAVFGEGVDLSGFATLLAAITGSYLATAAEHWSILARAPAGDPDVDTEPGSARYMAASAAHDAMLGRLAMQPGEWGEPTR